MRLRAGPVFCIFFFFFVLDDMDDVTCELLLLWKIHMFKEDAERERKELEARLRQEYQVRECETDSSIRRVGCCQ